MAVTFVNESTEVSNDDMQNATTNMYNNSPHFKSMVDDLNATGLDVKVHIIDGDLPFANKDDFEFIRRKSVATREDTSPTDEQRETNQELYRTLGRDENGIRPFPDGTKIKEATIYIHTNSIRGGATAADTDHDRLSDDKDHDGKADQIFEMTYERVLAHELFHIRQYIDGRSSGDIGRYAMENDATDFEAKIMNDITRPDDPRGLNRSHESYKGLSEPVYIPENFGKQLEVQTINPSTPPEGTTVPWEWEKTSGTPRGWKPSQDTQNADQQSQFLPEDDKNAEQSNFAATMAKQQQSTHNTPVFEETAPAPATPDAPST